MSLQTVIILVQKLAIEVILVSEAFLANVAFESGWIDSLTFVVLMTDTIIIN
jgi:hypothetical protein